MKKDTEIITAVFGIIFAVIGTFLFKLKDPGAQVLFFSGAIFIALSIILISIRQACEIIQADIHNYIDKKFPQGNKELFIDPWWPGKVPASLVTDDSSLEGVRTQDVGGERLGDN